MPIEGCTWGTTGSRLIASSCFPVGRIAPGTPPAGELTAGGTNHRGCLERQRIQHHASCTVHLLPAFRVQSRSGHRDGVPLERVVAARALHSIVHNLLTCAGS